MKKERFIQEVNYNVAGGDKIFPEVEYQSTNSCTIQIEYSGFNTDTAKIIIEHKIGTKFDAIPFEAILRAADGTETLILSGFNTDVIRLKLQRNTLTTGTIISIHYLFD